MVAFNFGDKNKVVHFGSKRISNWRSIKRKMLIEEGTHQLRLES